MPSKKKLMELQRQREAFIAMYNDGKMKRVEPVVIKDLEDILTEQKLMQAHESMNDLDIFDDIPILTSVVN